MTNGLRPRISRSAPAGSGGAGSAGRGMRKVVRARTTALEGPASRWPTSALAPATPTATEPVIRNSRRPDPDRAGAGGSGVPDGTQDPPGGGAAPVAAGVVPVPAGGAATVGPASATGPVCPAVAARTSRTMVNAPAAAPIRMGSASIALAFGRVPTASSPISVNTASPASP